MNYIIFNNDGSIKNLGFADIIVQGDDNTDEIYCAIEGRSNDAYLATAYFELPNGDSNSLSGVASSFSVDGSTYQGYKITLTASQTVFAGNVRMSLRLEGTGIKWTYNVILTINESGYDPDEVAITMAQYDNLVTAMGAKQDKYVLNNARFYASLQAAQADLENLAINQCFIVANPAQPSVYPTIYYKTAQGTIQELNTLGQFDSPTIDVETATLAPSSPATVGIHSATSGNAWSLDFSFGIPKGDPGAAATINVGAVTTVSPDTPASVRNVGSQSAAVFNFDIPRGRDGQDGQDGDYVAYNLGDYQEWSFATLCSSARTYYQTDRPYGQTCYATYNVHGSSYRCWFLTTKTPNILFCLRNSTPILCQYRNSQWYFTRLMPVPSYSTGNLGTLIPGLYAIEYRPNGAGTTALTVMLSVTDTSTSARSSRGETLEGNEWHANYTSGVTNSIKIWDNGSEVSNPNITISMVVNYPTTNIDY